MSRLMEDLSSFPSTASTSQEDHENSLGSTSSRKLRVTLLSSEWRSKKGGLSTINRELAIQLAKHPSVEVSVYLPKCSEEDKRVAASHNVHLIEAEEMAGYDNPVDWLSSLPDGHAVDCVIGHGAILGRQVQFIKRHCNCKWIQVVHTAPEELGMFKSYTDAISRGEKKHQAEVKLSEKADQVVAVGPKLAEAFSGYLRVCGKDQDVLNLTPGIFSEFSDVKQATEERKTFSVLVFGRGDNEDFQLKGYDIAARAIAELKEEPQPYKLFFVGAPSGEEEKVKDLLLQQGIDRSQLTVRCFNESREQLARLFCEVDLAIMPSRTEGFGLAALEALSAGLPVLVSGNSGLGEALKEVPIGSNCVVESEDAKDWANAIRAVRKKKRKLRLREAKLLQGEYAEMYSWQDHCNRLVERMLTISKVPSTDEQNLSKKATVICHDEKSSPTEKHHYKGSTKKRLSFKIGKRPLSSSNFPAPKYPRILKDEGWFISVVVKFLKAEYKRRSHLRPLFWDSIFELPLDDVYTRLKIVSRRKADFRAEDNDVNVFDIFTALDKGENVMTLVEGSPGIGKTTFCLKLAYDWAHGKIPAECSFFKFKLVLLLKCRDIREDIMESISEQLLPEDIEEKTKEGVFDFIKDIRNREKTLIVLDGLDELPQGSEQFVDKLLQRRILSFCYVLATSRQERGIDIRKRYYFDILLEIKGFTESDACEYIRKHFKNVGPLHSSKGESLIKEMEENTLLHALRNNPLTLLLLCYIYEDYEGNLPPSRTELYQDIVLCLLRRYCAKRNLEAPKDSSDLKKQFKESLLTLGQLAWICVLSDRYCFREDELAELEIRYKGLVARELGLLYKKVSLERLKPQHEYCFLHETFQEYLSAVYIVEKLVNQQFNVFERISFDDFVTKYPQVFIFVSGMLGEKATVLFTQIGAELKKSYDWNWIEHCNEKTATFFIQSFNESGHAEQMAVTLCNIIPFPKVITSQMKEYNEFFVKVLTACRSFSNLQAPVELYADTCEGYRDERDIVADAVESSPQLATAVGPDQGGKDATPSEILARGRIAIDAYRRALLEGKGYARRVPVMIIGQARTGKTSLKRSLKGELFNPNEGSTKGIETDPSYFKVSTDVWRTGKNSKDTQSEPTFSFEHQTAQWIVERLEERKTGSCYAEELSSIINELSPQDSKRAEKVKAYSIKEPSSEGMTPSRQVSHDHLRVPKLPEDRTALVQKLPEKFGEIEKDKGYSEESSAEGMTPSRQVSHDHLRVRKLPEDIAALVQKLLEKSDNDKDDIYSIIWDFGGQSVYYDTHPIFLTRKAIYILACNLSCDPHQKADPPTKKGMGGNMEDVCCSKTNLDYLDFWMSSVYSLVRPGVVSKELPAVFLACTHADKKIQSANPSKIYDSLKDKVYKKLLKDLCVVDNTKAGSGDECRGVKKLREKVLSFAKKLPQMNEAIPLKWLKFEKVLYLLSQDGYKWISIEKASQIATEECGISEDEKTIRTLLDFLHDQRVLINFSEPPELKSMVILDPQWLIDVFKEVITVKSWEDVEDFGDLWRSFQETGILDEKVLDHAWRSLIDTDDNRETCKSTLISIMERFNLLFSWPSSDGTTKQYLVPSMLMSPPTEKVLKHLDCVRIPSLFVAFGSRRVPSGFFSRLLLLFYRLCQKEWKRDVNPQMFKDFAMFHILPERAISLVFMLHSSSIEIVFHDGKDARDLSISRTIYSQLKCLLERICKEFFWLKHVKYRMCVCCPVCSQDDVTCRAHGMRGCECLHFLSESELHEWPYCNKPGICGDPTITITMFEHWFALSDFQQSRIPLTQEQSAIEGDNTEKLFLCCSEESASETSATDPPQVIARQIRNKDLPPKSKHFDYCQIQVDILLLTVMKEDTCEDCEFLSCLAYLNPDFCKSHHPDLGYVYLGDIGEDDLKLNVAVMKCYEGSSSTGGSIVVVINAVRVLKPKAVFWVGCCSGLNDTKVSLGDVVVLKKLVTYAFSKVTENGIEELGVKVPLKRHLSKLILGVGDGWTPPLKDPKALEVKVHRGTFLSGPEVINNHRRCNALIERFPEAVAIEREGEGVFAAAHDLDIEWVVIKGISGYADGRKVKDSWRAFASVMAASLTAHILSDTIAFQAWPHYGSARKHRKCSLETDEVDAELDWDRGIIKKHKSGVN